MKLLLVIASIYTLGLGCQGIEATKKSQDSEQDEMETPQNQNDGSGTENTNQSGDGAATTEADQDFLQTALIYKTSENVAVNGADVVAYFSLVDQADHVAGDAEHSYEWNDVEWRFSSAENRDAFADNPSMYAPQFGGYCAWAASQGYKAQTDPDAWSVVDGKLYLNASKNIRSVWLDSVDQRIQDGNKNWPSIVGGQ